MLADFRYALRSLAVSRGLSAAAIFTLALGIRAHTAIFTVVYGIRMALGAHPRSLMRLFVRRSLTPVVIGAIIGTDPMSLAIAAILLTVVACGSAYVPARRAATVDPLVALRIP